MYCPNCGNYVPDDAKFCNSCGTGISQTGVQAPGASPQASPQASPNAGVVNNVGSGKIKGKKNLKMLVMIAGVVVVFILAGVIVLANMWRIMPGKSYYSYLETKNTLVSFNKLYKDAIKATEIESGSKDIEFTIKSLGSDEDVPSSVNLEDMSLRAQVDYSKNKTQGYISLNYEGSALLDAKIYKDKDTVGLGLPLLYDDNFSCKIDKLQELMYGRMGQEIPDETSINQKSLDEFKKELDGDTKYLDKALAKYAKIAMKSISSDSIEVSGADGITGIYTWKNGTRKRAMELENARLIQIKITQGDMYNILDKVLEEAIKDDKLIELIYKYAKTGDLITEYRYGFDIDDINDINIEVTKEDITEIKEELERIREDLEYEFDLESKEVLMTIKVVADSKNNIVSREINIDDARITFSSYTDEKDGNRINELNFAESRYSDDGPFTIYVYDGEKGKGFLALEDDESVEFTYSRKGEGKNSIGLDYGTYRVKIDQSNNLFEGILTVENNDNSKDGEKLNLRLLQDNDEFISLDIRVKELKDKSNLNFNKKKAIDLANADEEELEDIMEEIESNYEMITEDIRWLLGM